MLHRIVLLCVLFCYTIHLYSQSSEVNSSFGKVFTPKGNLRILIIFAGFKGYDHEQSVGNWSPSDSLPPWDFKDLFYSDTADFLKYAKDSTVKNLSKLYYELSNPQNRFKLIADIFPHRININPEKGYSFSQYNRMVIEKMKSSYPLFDWAPYDNRTNLPTYRFDNSLSKPDCKPDYVFIAYRYAVSWKILPHKDMLSWAPVYSRLDGLNGLDYNGYTFDGAGFTMGAFDGRMDYFKDLFIHELAHELYSSPHYSGANGALGNYFHLPNVGWDFMNSAGGATCNAFERWLLGWTEIKHDLHDSLPAGIYELEDFVASGNAIRIKIPHTKNQFLWIEYHQLKSVFDHKPWRGSLLNQPAGTKGIADKEPGIYMFVESILADRSQITEALVYEPDKINGIMPLHAEGNFDYPKPQKYTLSPEEYWNNKLYWFERGEENPISGINPYISYRNDMDSSGSINHIYSPHGAFNGMKDAENYAIIKEVLNGKPTLTYASISGRNADARPYRRSDAFQAGDELGLNTNPMVVNRPEFDLYHDSLGPFYLNSIGIKILKIDSGRATLAINFNETEVFSNRRWCGNIVLKPLNYRRQEYDLRIAGKTKIVFNKSAIPNKLKRPFVSPTSFIIDSGAVLYLDEGAMLVLQDSSSLIVKSGSTLLMAKNASIVLKDDATCIIQPGAKVVLHKTAMLEVKNKKQVKIQEAGSINRPRNVLVKK